MNIVIKPSNKPNKKFMAIIENKKTVHFGNKMYEYYTMHKNGTKKKYISIKT